jgi:hypothetical protein
MGENVKPMVRRSLPLLVVLALSLQAQVIPLPHATLGELANAPDIPSSRAHEQFRVAQTFLSAQSWATLPEQTTASALQPPPLGTNFSAGGSNSLYPVDAAGAVGPQQIVSVFNNGLFVYDRNGNRTSAITLAQFWSDPSISAGDYYDPRIIYDAAANRWFIAALYDRNLKNSTVVIGVSDGGDPNGSWSRYRIPVDSQNARVADFTRLGMTADKFIITTNSSFGGSEFWSMTKADAYTTLKTVKHTFSIHPDFQPVTFVDNSTTTAFMVTNGGAGFADLWRLDDTPTFLAQFTTAPWDEPFNTEIAPTGIGGKMDMGETTMQAAVGRNGVIFAVHAIVSTTAPVHSGIRWWRILTDGTGAETGTIDDPTARTFYGFPSIAMNRAGGALIGYSLFSVDRFPAAGYSYRDPSGAMSSSGVLKDGEAVPHVTRWGDYTTTVVDPANDLDFWSVQPYGNNQLWGAWWGKIAIPVAPARVRAVRH